MISLSAFVIQKHKLARREGDSMLNEIANEQTLNARRKLARRKARDQE